MVICSSCNKQIRKEKNNIALQINPYPCERGFGWCKKCFGDEKSKNFKKRIGLIGQIFFETIFIIIKSYLSEENKKRWNTLTYEQKCYVVAKMIEKKIF